MDKLQRVQKDTGKTVFNFDSIQTFNPFHSDKFECQIAPRRKQEKLPRRESAG